MRTKLARPDSTPFQTLHRIIEDRTIPSRQRVIIRVSLDLLDLVWSGSAVIAAVSNRFRQSLGGVTFPDTEGHTAVRDATVKHLKSLANIQKVTEFHPAFCVHLAGYPHD